MRLSDAQITTIKTISRTMAPEAEVRLFGSRLDDDKRGGDIDVFLSFDQPVLEPALFSAKLSARLSRALGHREVDVVISAPNLNESSIHKHARETGISL